MIKVRWSTFAVWSLLALGLIASVLVTRRDFEIKDEHGQRLVIPRSYVTSYDSLVAAFVPRGGGDRSDLSVSVTIPKKEIVSALPDIPLDGGDFRFLLHLLPPWQNIDLQYQARVREIIDHKERWSDPQWRDLDKPGWYRVHNGDWESYYAVVYVDESVPGATRADGEWIASCTSSTMCLTQFSVDRVAVDTYLSQEQLLYRNGLRDLVARKLATWEVAQ